MATYGYVLVKSDGLSLSVQEAQLRQAGASTTFADEVANARNSRSELRKVLKCLQPGDVLLATRLDRVAWSTHDLLDIIEAVTKAGARFKSLGDAWADTTAVRGRVLLTALRGLAEFQRKRSRARRGDRRRRAQARGVKLGRQPKLTPDQRQNAISYLKRGWSQADLAHACGVSQSTISRLIR